MNELSKKQRLGIFSSYDPFGFVFERGLADIMLGWPDWNWPTTSIVSDFSESDRSFTVKAEVPGTKETDIKVEYGDNTLTITSETRKDNEEGQSRHKERYYGKSTRSYYMPNVDKDQISASLRDGVLSVTCPKIANGSDRKQIPVKTD
jgi:HSP20 family protein